MQHGANPNCSYRANLTPLHVLIFTVSENFALNCDTQKRANFDFIKNILNLLLQHGLDCDLTYQHILQAVMDMVQNVRTCPDMLCIYELTLALIQYGADPNIVLSIKSTSGSTIYSNEIANFGDGLGHTSNSFSEDAVGPSNGAAVVSFSGAVNSGASEPSCSRQMLGENTLRNSFRTNSRYLLFYYIILITKRDFLLSDPELTFTRVIHLFFITMRHEPLYNCLKSLHNFYVAQVPKKNTEQLISLLSLLYKRPRSLKQLSRIAIYEALNKKLAQNIARLNLPGPLKDYVLHFES